MLVIFIVIKVNEDGLMNISLANIRTTATVHRAKHQLAGNQKAGQTHQSWSPLITATIDKCNQF